jgi:hypothetical protein
VHSDRTVPNNKPDITICGNKKGTCMLIDAAISEDRKKLRRFSNTKNS